MGEHIQKPLKADEIEALLRAARDVEPSHRSDVVSNEPLGPGDVQHLRNTSLQDDILADDEWPFDGDSAERSLQRAERHLSAAMSTDAEPPEVSRPAVPHQFPPLEASASSTVGLPLAVIGDIELEVTLELGRAELTIEDLLALREGSVVTLDKEAGEVIDILANGRLVARGEVIVVDDKFCVRICEVPGS
jgi:flagellar motor switch protein FliN/FliY